MAVVVFNICCFLMALLFATSAFFQYNDPDWYLWIPLYATACIVNLVNRLGIQTKVKHLQKLTLSLGSFLFIKVIMEDTNEMLSLNMRKRVVREKLGSGLVIGSISLQLSTSAAANHPIRGRTQKIPKHSIYCMLILVAIGYGFSFAFFTFQRTEMEF